MTSSIARIHVNGIEVGSLPAETYQAIAKNVRKDRRLYLAWVISAAWAVVRMLLKFYGALPSVVVGLFLLCAAVSSETFTGILTDLKAAEPEAVTEGLRRLLGFICIIFTVTVPVVAVFVSWIHPLSKPIRRCFESSNLQPAGSAHRGIP
ncbi:hypothetical protein AWM79_12155 [Pseudomonas agarici]|uniref:Uncharacterized protein n=1 Tax=Pseudomonas agarici TaxID=46677 RepID=A0A0X1T1R0_PSEAA|nr:hypothetical protein [Pseudomonas agarici]AMB86010.1 hypothetical protein AWM79_12155 [Pseudomonas agarici]